MSSGSQDRLDSVSARAHDLHAVVPGGRDPSPTPVVAASNVVPFLRVRREPAAIEPAPPLPADLSQRPAPDVPGPEGRLQMSALLALSLAVHGGLYAVFSREPEPMASIGVEVMSVEIVLGDNKPAGIVATPVESQAQSAPANDPDPKPMDRETMDKQAAEAKPEQLAAAPAEPMPAPHEPELSSPPQETQPATPEPAKPQAKPVKQPKPEGDLKPKQGPRAKTTSTEPEATAPRANPQSGAGIGRSQSYSNWVGMLQAHLAKYQRPKTEEGRVTVSFALDASGKVKRVSLVQGSGFATLDQDAQASVWRASPFPPPPLGRGDATVSLHYHR